VSASFSRFIASPDHFFLALTHAIPLSTVLQLRLGLARALPRALFYYDVGVASREQRPESLEQGGDNKEQRTWRREQRAQNRVQ
jgi:hypothetical protein